MGGNSCKSESAKSLGSMRLYFDKSEYVPGELVKGRIVLSLLHAITSCSSITIRFKGQEQMIYKGQSEKPHQTFDRVVHVINLNAATLPQGQSSFEFEYLLPNTLQPSYYISKLGGRSFTKESGEPQITVQEEADSDEVRFSLLYMMIALAEIKDNEILDLQAVNIMRIGQPENSLPVKEQFSTRLRNIFGDQGLYNQIVRIDRNEFYSGELIAIHLIVENVGRLAMSEIQLELVREQIIFGPVTKRNQKRKILGINKKIIPVNFAGRTSNNQLDIEFAMPLNTKVLCASFSGGAFSCRYLFAFTFVFPNQCFGKFKITKNIPITILDRQQQEKNILSILPLQQPLRTEEVPLVVQ